MQLLDELLDPPQLGLTQRDDDSQLTILLLERLRTIDDRGLIQVADLSGLDIVDP